MFEIADRGVVYDTTAQPTENRIAYFTSLCLLHSGAILCGYQNGPGKHSPTSRAGVSRSLDQGRTWSPLPVKFETVIDGIPGSLGCAEMTEIRPGRLIALTTWFDRSDPTRPLFDPVTEGILKSRQLMAVSTDDGETWSAWRELSTGDLKGCALCGPAVIWPDGQLAIAFESFKEYDDPRPGRHAAWVIVSQDGGETFSEPLQVAQHPQHEVYYWDERLCPGQLPGEFHAAFWTHDLAHQRDLAVHFRSGSITSEGIQLEPIRDLGIPGQIAAPWLIRDGTLVLFVVDRGRPGTMTLWVSRDRGLTWPESDKLLVYSHEERAAISQGRENIDFKQYWEDMGKWSFGHPAVRQLPDGDLLAAWYAGSPDCMSIHWARIHKG